MSRRFTIGRDKHCDVPVFDDSVSRLHAEIWLADDGSLIMADCGSANGTTVVRGKQKFPLRQDVMLPGDYVRMGSIMLSVQEMMEAVEAKFPGVLTPPAALTPHAAVPPPPPVAYAPQPPPPPQPQAARPGGVLIRCECGAVKTQGQVCPGCHR
jgi:predicted component of type VI protein secretion system